MNRPRALALTTGLALALLATHRANAAAPKVGESAADFTLKAPDGTPVRLATLNEKGPVVLVVFRGWPGYQCPICTKRVGEPIARSKELASAKVQVLLVYPGPSNGLIEHADEFARGKSLPDNFHLPVDPDYTFTRAYDLRRQAPGETAYPSTFVIGPLGKVAFARTSRSHGDRAPTRDVIEALNRK